MAYLKHSFTLPSSLRKSKRNKEAKQEFVPLSSLTRSPNLSRSETTLYVKTESDGRCTSFIPMDNIEDTLSRRKSTVLDFYGGHPLPEYSPPFAVSSHSQPYDDHSDYGSDSMAHSEVDSILTDTGSTSVTISSSSSTCDTSSEMDMKNESSGPSDVFSAHENDTKTSEWQLLNDLVSCPCYCVGYCNCPAPPIYRMKLPCCQTMEPLWESAPVEDTPTYRSRKRTINWYDRKLKHKSCPLLQAHMVAAFEQSLSNMTSRLQHLTASAEQKDSELTELRKTIDALKQQSAEAGLTKMALQSMQAVQRSTGATNLVRRHTFNTTKDTGETCKTNNECAVHDSSACLPDNF